MSGSTEDNQRGPGGSGEEAGGRPAPVVERAWAQAAASVAESLGVDVDRGLDEREVRRRRERYGENALTTRRRTPWWTLLLEQFRSVLVYVLGAAAVVAAATARWPEAIALVAVIVVNTAIGFLSELRATRSMEALRRLGQERAHVRRGGRRDEVAAGDLVPGDVLLLGAGDAVTADVRLVEATDLSVDESALTGESVSVRKGTDQEGTDQAGGSDGETPLAERSCMAFRGTTVRQGEGVGVVVATGMATELGRITELVRESAEKTPMERRLDALAWRLVWVMLGAAAVVTVSGVLAGRDIEEMVETGIALGAAAVPEGMPIVATLALARGMWRMARRNAVVNRLGAVETLSATDVILVDKTGTLTENRMTLGAVVTEGGRVEVAVDDGEPRFERDGSGVDLGSCEPLRRALEVGALCGNVWRDEEEGVWQGDPLEVALVEAAAGAGMTRSDLLEAQPEAREVPFDSETLMMATVHRAEGGSARGAIKGAPEAVVDACARVMREDGEATALDDGRREAWKRRAHELAEGGLRVLGVAEREMGGEGDDPYDGPTLLGLVGLEDPPREGVREAIGRARGAGVRVVMATGDQATTAQSVAVQVGLVEDDAGAPVEGRDLPKFDRMSDEDRRRVLEAEIFARVSPEQKLDLIEAFQAAGHRVAMTGDGVNDAPALERADIGIAMGRRGTPAARQASDIILRDDFLGTIVEAIREGRVIVSNIRKSLVFMLATNAAEILAVGVAAALGAPLPLLALQILYLNVGTDVLPALALAVSPDSGKTLERGPRPPDEPILTREGWASIGGLGALLAACVLLAEWLTLTRLELSEAQAVTCSFLTLAVGKLWVTLALRERRSPALVNEVTRNPWVWAALAVCVGLLAAAVYLPPLSALLRTEAPTPAGYGVVLGLSLVPALAFSAAQSARRRRA